MAGGAETEKPYFGRSITDLVAFFFVLAAASFAIIAIPVQDLHTKLSADPWVRVEHLFGALLLPAALVLYAASTYMWRARQRRLARGISTLVPEEEISDLLSPETQNLLDS